MIKSRKKGIIVAIVLISLGLLIFLGGMAALNFDFTKLSTVKYETNVYRPEGDFNKISIDVSETEITFALSDDGGCRVECYEEDKVKHTAVVEDGVLQIDTVDARKWYDNINATFGQAKMTIYLPKEEYSVLSVEAGTGSVEVPAEFGFENLYISGDSADVECLASVTNCIEISTDTGNIKVDAIGGKKMELSTDTGDINVASVTMEDEVKVETDTGYINLTDLKCEELSAESETGNVSLINVASQGKFNIKNDTGDVKLENSDAGDILIETGSGNVIGTLLSEKVFITETDTGDISVPKTITGGRCEIKTDTGNIKIDIA